MFNFHFMHHVLRMPTSDETDSESEYSTQVKTVSLQNKYEPLPWQLPSPRDYEGYSLEDDLLVKQYRVENSDSEDKDSESDDLPPLPQREATILSSSLPKRRYKLKFHTDAKPKQPAKIDPKWESQLTYVEPDEKTEAIKKELASLKQTESEQNEKKEDNTDTQDASTTVGSSETNDSPNHLPQQPYRTHSKARR